MCVFFFFLLSVMYLKQVRQSLLLDKSCCCVFYAGLRRWKCSGLRENSLCKYAEAPSFATSVMLAPLLPCMWVSKTTTPCSLLAHFLLTPCSLLPLCHKRSWTKVCGQPCQWFDDLACKASQLQPAKKVVTR